jgi:hypothetical protein
MELFKIRWNWMKYKLKLLLIINFRKRNIKMKHLRIVYQNKQNKKIHPLSLIKLQKLYQKNNLHIQLQ